MGSNSDRIAVLTGKAPGSPPSTPAAACTRCGGWTAFGGMSQYAHSKVPVHGRVGCACHTLAALRGAA